MRDERTTTVVFKTAPPWGFSVWGCCTVCLFELGFRQFGCLACPLWKWNANQAMRYEWTTTIVFKTAPFLRLRSKDVWGWILRLQLRNFYLTLKFGCQPRCRCTTFCAKIFIALQPRLYCWQSSFDKYKFPILQCRVLYVIQKIVPRVIAYQNRSPVPQTLTTALILKTSVLLSITTTTVKHNT